MARTKAGAELTQLHRKQQMALRADVMRSVVKLFPTWDPHDEGSYRRLESSMRLVVKAGHEKSAKLASSYYQLFRTVDAPDSAIAIGAVVKWAKAIPEEQIAATLAALAKGSLYRSFGVGLSYTEAMNNAMVAVAGGMGRLAMLGGRDTVLNEVRTDPKAVGWCRVTSDAPCAFCAMLSSRGAVYKEDTVDFEAHDHCSCSAEPQYEGSQPPGRAKEFESLWRETASDVGHAPTVNDFRIALAKSRE